MVIKGLKDEDFVNYKKPAMFIAFPTCTWKCDKECGQQVCQNSALAHAPDIDISIDDLVERYISNPITKAIVIGGLEPFDSWTDLWKLIQAFRKQTEDDIVIYTGYKEFDNNAFDDHLETLCCLGENIIIKFGRYVPNQKPHYDEVLGVNLASDNQYAERIS